MAVAWRRVASNKGAAGPDGVSIKQIEESGVDEFLRELAEELGQRRYRSGPIRRVYIPSPLRAAHRQFVVDVFMRQQVVESVPDSGRIGDSAYANQRFAPRPARDEPAY